MSVLVGYAPTPEGRAALGRAVGECRLRATGLTVLLSAPRSPAAGEATEVVGPADLDAVLAELGAAGLARRVHRANPLRDLADQMLELADADDVDLIVIGLRRRTPAGKLILGSSAQRVLLEASCPVLAVKVDHRIILPTGGRVDSLGVAGLTAG